MTAFALYRLPHEERFTLVEQTEGEVLQLASLSQLNGRSGFVVAPFAVGESQPLLLIRADRVSQHPLSQLPQLTCHYRKRTAADGDRDTYAADFARFHAHLSSGEFRKIVLARSVADVRPAVADPVQLFQQACQRYPRLFVCLVSTPQSGTWLVATPEILLSETDSRWQTMALAGTMKLEGEQLAFDTSVPQGDLHIAWTDKNIQEQRYVATYVADCLERFTADFTERGPYTVRAGNLVHLRSDFRFTLPDAAPQPSGGGSPPAPRWGLGDVLTTLHPTPAVCGLPKRETFSFILQHEHAPRRYYSGFMGPLLLPSVPDAGVAVTHLYVSLRCMEVFADGYVLYAGGGLLPDSAEEQEWQETEAKMETMRNLIV